MRNKKLAIFTAAAGLAFVLCMPGTVPAADYGIQVTDMAGNDITLAEPAGRIVSLSPAGCEILNSIGGTGLLCGRAEICDYPEEILQVPTVGSGTEYSPEEIISLSPELVLAGQSDLTGEQSDALRNAGIPVAVCEAADIEGIMDAVLMTAELTGKAEIGGYVTDGMKSTIEILESSVDHLEVEKKTVLFMLPGEDGTIRTAGSGTILNGTAHLAGLANVFDDREGYFEVTSEEIISKNPDLIVSCAPDKRAAPMAEEDILAIPDFQDITAVREQSVRTFEGCEMCRPGPRAPEGAVMLYEFAYGEEDDLSMMAGY